jgi:hypothetical protein
VVRSKTGPPVSLIHKTSPAFCYSVLYINSTF